MKRRCQINNLVVTTTTKEYYGGCGVIVVESEYFGARRNSELGYLQNNQEVLYKHLWYDIDSERGTKPENGSTILNSKWLSFRKEYIFLHHKKSKFFVLRIRGM